MGPVGGNICLLVLVVVLLSMPMEMAIRESDCYCVSCLIS